MKVFVNVLAPVMLAMVLVVCAAATPNEAHSSAIPDWQSGAGGKMAFEVASIKPHAPDNGSRMAVGMGATDPSRWTAVNVTAKNLITEAYLVRSFQVLGGPAWIENEHFDVDAKVDDSTATQLQKMTRHEQNQQMD